MSKLTEYKINDIADDKQQAYYSLSYDIHIFRQKMLELRKGRGHITEFKLLDAALDLFERKIEEDYKRYVLRIKAFSERKELKEMQQSLNRERKTRAALEVKIKEASESSGLFIKFVRNKLGV